MKRGYLWVDWVELGCRGWNIDETGAGLNEEADDGNYAHLDKTTLHLLFAGNRPFVRQVLNNMVAAGMLEDRRPAVAWRTINDGTFTSSTADSAIYAHTLRMVA